MGPRRCRLSTSCGWEIATPDGKVPQPDPWGLEPFFHYPQVDEDLWEFDALTGKGTNPGNCQLTVFDTRVREGQIEVLAPGPE